MPGRRPGFRANGYPSVTHAVGAVTADVAACRAIYALASIDMDGDGQKKKLRLSIGYLILGLWVVLLLQQVLAAYLRPNRMPYSEFKADVAASKVEEVAIGQTLIQGRLTPPPQEGGWFNASVTQRRTIAVDWQP